MNLIIAYKSPNRYFNFEREMEKNLFLYKKYIIFDSSLSIRNKISFLISAYNPKLFFKIRFRK